MTGSSANDCATYSVFSSGENAMPFGAFSSFVSSVSVPLLARR